MKIEILPEVILKGKCFHCRPNKLGPIVRVRILNGGIQAGAMVDKIIVCPARISSSRCGLRQRKGKWGGYSPCHWRKGDGIKYQIIGPGMDKKTDG